MRDRLPYPEHFKPQVKPQTFGAWCEAHKVTDEEYELLFTYWIALRLRKSGLLAILMG